MSDFIKAITSSPHNYQHFILQLGNSPNFVGQHLYEATLAFDFSMFT